MNLVTTSQFGGKPPEEATAHIGEDEHFLPVRKTERCPPCAVYYRRKLLNFNGPEKIPAEFKDFPRWRGSPEGWSQGRI